MSAKIIKLTVENLMKLKAVEIIPEDNIVIITGGNGNGKTTVLNAIWFALGGVDAQKETPEPIRKGAESASVTLELDDLIITREWKSDGKTTLKVSTKTGAKYSSPQGILDKLVGALTFDPLSFSNMKEENRNKVILQLGGIEQEIATIDEQIKTAFDLRASLNKEYRTKKTNFETAVLPEFNLPDSELSISELNTQLQSANDIIAEHEKYRNALNIIKNEKDSNLTRQRGLEVDIETLEKQITHKKELLAIAVIDCENLTTRITNGEKIVEHFNKPDTKAVIEQIETAEKTNSAIRYRDQYSKMENEASYAKIEADRLDEDVKKLRLDKEKIIASAKLPIEGLGFSENGITYKDIPFSQCSAAEKLRVSLAMAMALNPTLKVIRIVDGSLLDKANMQIIREMADKNDYQIWIERVEDESEMAVEIEDGEVKKRTRKTKD